MTDETSAAVLLEARKGLRNVDEDLDAFLRYDRIENPYISTPARHNIVHDRYLPGANRGLVYTHRKWDTGNEHVLTPNAHEAIVQPCTAIAAPRRRRSRRQDA